MGPATEGEGDYERPLHSVTMSSFYMSKYEVSLGNSRNSIRGTTIFQRKIISL
jgi:formylglycine-generating enzyme required for sulfatase activity